MGAGRYGKRQLISPAEVLEHTMKESGPGVVGVVVGGGLELQQGRKCVWVRSLSVWERSG